MEGHRMCQHHIFLLVLLLVYIVRLLGKRDS